MNKTRLEAFSDGVIPILAAFASHRAAKAIYVLVALIWLIPDRLIERVLAHKEGAS